MVRNTFGLIFMLALVGSVLTISGLMGLEPPRHRTLDPATWTVHLEGDGKDAAGKAVHYVVDGKLENLGSGNRTLVGTWTEGTARGPIKLVRN